MSRILPRNEVFDIFRFLVVHLVKFRLESLPFAPYVDLLVCFEEFFFLSALYRDAFNEIGVENVKYADVLVTFV